MRRPAAVLRRPAAPGGKAVAKRPSAADAGAERATKKRPAGAPVEEAIPVRTFRVRTSGGLSAADGEQFEVQVLADSNVGLLEEEISRKCKVGFCVSLFAGDQMLCDTSACLPAVEELTAIPESLAELCPAARRVLERSFRSGLEDPEALQRLRLGRCRCLGKFPGSQWKRGGIQSAISDIESGDGDDRYDMYGSYSVYELTLVMEGEKRARLIGVVNEGNFDANTGMWGSVYLRPGLREVATIRSSGDSESVWSIKRDSWYTPPVVPLPACEWNMVRASTPLKRHLTHALECASAVEVEELKAESTSRGLPVRQPSSFDVD